MAVTLGGRSQASTGLASVEGRTRVRGGVPGCAREQCVAAEARRRHFTGVRCRRRAHRPVAVTCIAAWVRGIMKAVPGRCRPRTTLPAEKNPDRRNASILRTRAQLAAIQRQSGPSASDAAC